jgi:hypothetical protein
MGRDLSKLTENGQKEYSRISKSLRQQRSIIEKAEAYAKESPSDDVKRALAGVIHHQKQVDSHEEVMSSRIQKVIEEGRIDEKNKRQYLKDAEEKLERLQSKKSRQQVSAEMEVAKLEKELDNFLNSVGIPEDCPQFTQPLPGGCVKQEGVSAWEELMREERELEIIRGNRPTRETPYQLDMSIYGRVADLEKRA